MYNMDGVLNLFEAVMAQAYEDAEQNKDEALKKEAQKYIDRMKAIYSN